MRTVKLREISELKTGPFGTQFSANEYALEGTPVINVKNIGYGDIITTGLDYVRIDTLERLADHKLRKGDIVFGRRGSVDRHCLITKGQDGWMQGSDCIRVRFTDSFVLPDFVSYYLLTDAVKAKINNLFCKRVHFGMEGMKIILMKIILISKSQLKLLDVKK